MKSKRSFVISSLAHPEIDQSKITYERTWSLENKEISSLSPFLKWPLLSLWMISWQAMSGSGPGRQASGLGCVIHIFFFFLYLDALTSGPLLSWKTLLFPRSAIPKTAGSLQVCFANKKTIHLESPPQPPLFCSSHTQDHYPPAHISQGPGARQPGTVFLSQAQWNRLS